MSKLNKGERAVMYHAGTRSFYEAHVLAPVPLSDLSAQQRAGAEEPQIVNVVQDWVFERCNMQQQTVLFTAIRGPDNIAKYHQCKFLTAHYRATVVKNAKTGGAMKPGEGKGDNSNSFMTLAVLEDVDSWGVMVTRYLEHVDSLPHHFHMHLLHAAQIVGYKHPSNLFRTRWLRVYHRFVEDLHLGAENEALMDARLNDWGRKGGVNPFDQEYNPRL